MAKVLICFEESQRLADAFRRFGHEAYSLDIQPAGGGHPEWHIRTSFENFFLDKSIPSFSTSDGMYHDRPSVWDMIICHPPCTHLAYCNHHYVSDLQRSSALSVLSYCMLLPAKAIVIENPPGAAEIFFKRPPDFDLPFYSFGWDWNKHWLLWCNVSLPSVEPIYTVAPWCETVEGERANPYFAACQFLDTDLRRKARSRTPPLLAYAIAKAWSPWLDNCDK